MAHGVYYLRYGLASSPASIPDRFQRTRELKKIGEAWDVLRNLASMRLKVQSVSSFVFYNQSLKRMYIIFLKVSDGITMIYIASYNSACGYLNSDKLSTSIDSVNQWLSYHASICMPTVL